MSNLNKIKIDAPGVLQSIEASVSMPAPDPGFLLGTFAPKESMGLSSVCHISIDFLATRFELAAAMERIRNIFLESEPPQIRFKIKKKKRGGKAWKRKFMKLR